MSLRHGRVRFAANRWPILGFAAGEAEEMEEAKLQKQKLSVEMEIDGGARLMGHMFVAQNQRLPDLLNDNRDFLPFETTEGLITIVRKSTIRRVTPMNQITLPDINADPYEILGVAPSIPDEESQGHLPPQGAGVPSGQADRHGHAGRFRPTRQ